MYIKVWVQASARKESVTKVSNTSYKISVKEPAEQNLANKRVIQIIADQLHVTVQKVRIINGHHSPSKMFSVDVEKM